MTFHKGTDLNYVKNFIERNVEVKYLTQPMFMHALKEKYVITISKIVSDGGKVKNG